ncbi:MAG: hypothetical protein ABJN22_02985 [Litorimonas sp.]
MSDYDREQWQAEQAIQDQAQSAYRDKMAKARERSASNAKRKIARLHAKLTELGHISDFEDEFGESVLERLEKFGSAFHDLEKGRAGDALSIAQKQVVARMNKKVKDLRAKQKAADLEAPNPDADYVRTADRWKNESRKTGGFRSKRKTSFTPRVRNIEDELVEEEPVQRPINPAPPKLASVTAHPRKPKAEPYIPEYTPPPKPEAAKRPFLRIVPKSPN